MHIRELWGCAENNTRGNELETFLYENDLVVQNVGETPTFVSSRGKSIIDLTITSGMISESVKDWEVIPDLIDSDHRLIKFKINSNTELITKKHLGYDKVDWDKFRLVLTDLQRGHETPNTWNELTLEKQYNYLLGNIKRAMRLSIPYTAIQNTPRKPKFWNNELSAQRKVLRQAQRAWRNDIGNVTLRNNYIKIRCEYKRSIEKARFKCTSDTITSISNVKNMSQLVKICQGIDNKALGMLETPDGMTDSITGKNPLSRWQHGFRRTKSTETAIAEVVNYIESAMYQGEFAIAICLDIQGAFDNLNVAKANEALRNHGFPPWFLNWNGKFLHRCFVSVEYKGSKVLGEVTKGTPQGDVISTMAWDVGYDPLLVSINTKTACDGNGFADDCITLMEGKFLIDVLRECQKAINIRIGA